MSLKFLIRLHRLSLPSIRVDDRISIPRRPGCYYVFRHRRIIYIGKASDFWLRWSGRGKYGEHHQLKELYDSDRIHYWAMPKWRMHDREAVDIRRFNPPLNGRNEPREWLGRLATWADNLTIVLIVFLAVAIAYSIAG